MTASQDRDRTQLGAEAAAWLARLRSEDRTPADEAGFRDWLAEDPRHQLAFDATTVAWETVGALGVDRSRRLRDRRAARSAPVGRRMMIGGAVAAGMAVVGVLWSSGREGWTTYRTAVGEMRTMALSDGSRMVLDTDTAVKASLGPNRRRIELLNGRAHFDVAKDPSRPFIVAAASRQVVAVGTAFDVSRAPDVTTVLLLEGHVLVRERHGVASERIADLDTPGARLTLQAGGRVVQDRPDLKRLTAWRSGRLVFENDTLAAAVAEMNRYSTRQIVLGSPGLTRLRFSGVYVSGDPLAFATSVAALFDLSMRDEPTRTVLLRTSSTP